MLYRCLLKSLLFKGVRHLLKADYLLPNAAFRIVLIAALLLLTAGSGSAQSWLWHRYYLSGSNAYTHSSYSGSAKLGLNSYVHAGTINVLTTGTCPYFVFTTARGDSTGVIISSTYAGTPIRFGGATSIVGNGDGTFTWLGIIDTTVTAVRTQRHTLVKMNAQGQALWSRSFHLPQAGTGRPIASGPTPLLRTPDGYIAAANTLFFVAPTGTAWLDRQTVSKFDNQGRMEWEVTFPAYAAQSQDLAPQANGSYVVTGWQLVPTPLTTSGYFSLDWHLVEFTHRGNTIRTKRFGIDGDHESAYRVVPTADKGLAVLMQYQARVPANSPLEQRLVKLDLLWQVQWQTTLTGGFFEDLIVNDAGEYVLAGGYNSGGRVLPRLVRYSATGQPVWTGTYGFLGHGDAYLLRLVHEPGDPLMAWGYTMAPNPPGPGVAPVTQRFYSVGLGNVPPAFEPDYCRYPPQPNLAYQQPQADSLVLQELSTAGPQYAQNVRYRWELGDGTVVERPTGGVLRHRYLGALPAPGTPVTLTVTNNLGCTGSYVVYPFGRPTASQQSQALAERASLFPNPATGSATLRLQQAPAGLVTVRVLNALGQLVQAYSRQPQAGTLELDLEVSQLPAGVYAVQVSTAAGYFVKRLVRQ
jgi:hypothetical protein